MDTLNVLIFVHGMRTEDEVGSPYDKYNRFWERLVDNGVSKHWPVVRVEYGHEIPNVDEPRIDQKLFGAAQYIARKTKWESVKNGTNTHGFGTDPLHGLADILRTNIVLHGLGDVAFYAGEGRQHIQDAVFEQICAEIRKLSGKHRPINMHFICQSFGNVLVYDLLEQLTKGVNVDRNAACFHILTDCHKLVKEGKLHLGSWSSSAVVLPVMLLRSVEAVESFYEGEKLSTRSIGLRQTKPRLGKPNPIQWKMFFEADDPLGFAARELFDDPAEVIAQHRVSFTANPVTAHTDYWSHKHVQEETSKLILANSKAQQASPSWNAVLGSSKSFKRIAVKPASFFEGPCTNSKGNLFFSNVLRRELWALEGSKIYKLFKFKDKTRTNGLAWGTVDNIERLWGCDMGSLNNGGRVVEIDFVKQQGCTLVAKYDGKPLDMPNDLTLTNNSGMFFSAPGIPIDLENIDSPPEWITDWLSDLSTDKAPQGVYYCTRGKSNQPPVLATTEVKKPNGVLLSKDGKTLYVVQHNLKEVVKFEVENGKELKNKEVFGELSCDGGDGICRDDDDNIYIATGNCVDVFDKNGKRKESIQLPWFDRWMKVSNITFAGPKHDILYATAYDPIAYNWSGLFAYPVQ